MITKKYNYIFIDLDDTIWDFKANAKDALFDIYTKRIKPLTTASFEEFFSKYVVHNEKLWGQYGIGEIDKATLTFERFYRPLKDIGLDNSEIALDINENYLNILAEKTKLIQGAEKFLNLCIANKIPLTLISNGFTKVQLKKLSNSKIEHFFDHIVLSEKVGLLKPNPKIFEHALHLNSAKKEEVIMIGDSFGADIQGAINAGIDSIYLNPKRKNNVPLHKSVKEVVNMQEIIDYLY